MNRRDFLKCSGLVGLSIAGGLTIDLSPAFAAGGDVRDWFDISLAQWSLNRSFFGKGKPKIDNLEFAKIAKSLGISALEYVNQFFFDKGKDKAYLGEMKQRADDLGVKSVLIMCDREGNIGDPDSAKRIQTVENHYKWVEAAKFLGCHSIRVNAYSSGSYDEQIKLVADGLGRLCEFAKPYGLNVIVENHGGNSSNGKWLSTVMKQVNLPNCGTLPDFGNFGDYDRYIGVEELMPFAKGVSAKSSGKFDTDGNDMNIDYHRIMRIVRDAGYKGYVGIESAPVDGDEYEGIRKVKALLDRIKLQHRKIKPIFNGKNLDGWVRIKGGDWTIEDGVLIASKGRDWTTNPEVTGSWLRTEKMVSDFRLELQFAIGSRSNSGIFFRSAAEKNPAFTGYEMQIYDAHGRPASIKGPGAIYDTAEPSANMIRPAGQWNYLTITCKGPRIIIDFNGTRTIDTTLDRSLKGYIGLQNHDDRSVVKFKNIRLQEL